MKKKLFLAAGVIFGLWLLYVLAWRFDFSHGKPNWGITFSTLYVTRDLGLDWRQVYEAILDEMPVKKLRLIAYWNQVEREKGNYDFSDLDFQVREAEKKNKEVQLVLGFRVPRWPECHIPSWVPKTSDKDFEDALMDYLRSVVTRYKPSPVIKVWQIENEPLLTYFGECPPPDRELLKREIALVKSLDPRPILVTDSGELSLWLRVGGLSDLFGTTLYRVVWTEKFGWINYFYPPSFYTARAWILKTFLHTEDVIVSELQAEPWAEGGGSVSAVQFDKQIEHFPMAQLKGNMDFARQAGFKEIYLWGPEWWYFRKVKGDPSFWDFAKENLR